MKKFQAMGELITYMVGVNAPSGVFFTTALAKNGGNIFKIPLDEWEKV